jgi:hypothetical protein
VADRKVGGHPLRQRNASRVRSRRGRLGGLWSPCAAGMQEKGKQWAGGAR